MLLTTSEFINLYLPFQSTFQGHANTRPNDGFITYETIGDAIKAI